MLEEQAGRERQGWDLLPCREEWFQEPDEALLLEKETQLGFARTNRVRKNWETGELGNGFLRGLAGEGGLAQLLSLWFSSLYRKGTYVLSGIRAVLWREAHGMDL